MKNSLKTILLVGSATLALLGCGCSTQKDPNASKAKLEFTQEEKKLLDPLEGVFQHEFTTTEYEEKALKYWENGSSEKLKEAAMFGDPAAMHMLGLKAMQLKPSQDSPWFNSAASLGFGPSIAKIIEKYSHDHQKIFVLYSYAGLLASLGHPEFSTIYKAGMDDLARVFGKPVVDEIERIAWEKRATIRKNIRLYRESVNGTDATMKIMVQSIVQEDETKYNDQYWSLFLTPECRKKIPETPYDTWKNNPFEFTAKEEKALRLWKGKSTRAVGKAGLQGDPAAMHWLGLTDPASSHPEIWFFGAASLGFGPSLFKILVTYAQDERNAFFVLIYANLLCSFDHPEAVRFYQTRRALLEETFGEAVALEIERIAAKKKKIILKNRETLRKAGDLTHETVEIILENIVKEDRTYNAQYWKDFLDPDILQWMFPKEDDAAKTIGAPRRP